MFTGTVHQNFYNYPIIYYALHLFQSYTSIQKFRLRVQKSGFLEIDTFIQHECIEMYKKWQFKVLQKIYISNAIGLNFFICQRILI